MSEPDEPGAYQEASSSRNPPTESKSNISSLLNHLRITPVSFALVPRTSNILLLTPYLARPPPHYNPSLSMDPFEPFGRALGSYHPAIRHMPYVPKRGMIEVHQQLLQQAGAVIVVVCAYGVEDEEAKEHQELFARSAARIARRLGIQSLLISMGTEFDGIGKFGGVIKCSNWKELENQAGVIFAR